MRSVIGVLFALAGACSGLVPTTTDAGGVTDAGGGPPDASTDCSTGPSGPYLLPTTAVPGFVCPVGYRFANPTILLTFATPTDGGTGISVQLVGYALDAGTCLPAWRGCDVTLTCDVHGGTSNSSLNLHYATATNAFVGTSSDVCYCDEIEGIVPPLGFSENCVIDGGHI
jgi:hypothetical protein